jgi:hypothetical protein
MRERVRFTTNRAGPAFDRAWIAFGMPSPDIVAQFALV